MNRLNKAKRGKIMPNVDKMPNVKAQMSKIID